MTTTTKPSALALRIADSLVSEGSAHDVMDAARMIDAELAPLVEALRVAEARVAHSARTANSIARREAAKDLGAIRAALARAEGGAR